MDEQADAAREYERLRAELAEFVLDAVSDRIAAGQQPRLSQALVDAIERRVDQAVAARLGDADWPDPGAFADSVIAAAAGRGGGAARGSTSGSGSRLRRPLPPEPFLTRGRLILLSVVGVALVAVVTWWVLTRATPVTRTETHNGLNVIVEQPPGNALNVQQPVANGVVPPATNGVNGVR